MDERKLTGSERDMLKCLRRVREIMYGPNPAAALPYMQEKCEAAEESLKGLSQTQENERFDNTTGKWARREAAALDYFEQAKQLLRGACNMADMPQAWAEACALKLMGGYDHRDESGHHLLAGAAIWLLDHAYAQGKLEELLALLPAHITPMPLCEGAEPPFCTMPMIQHPLYQMNDIWRLIRLLANRNAELVRPAMVACSVADEWTVSVRRKPTEGCPQRQAFEAIMKLVDPAAAMRAAEQFEKKLWEFTGLALSANQIIEEKLKRYERNILALESKQGYSGNRLQGPSRLPANWQVLGKADSKRERLEQELNEEREKYDAFFQKIGGLRTELALPNEREQCLKKLQNELPSDMYDKLLHFHVDDPYEICFAILYLLDQGSNVPWIYYGALSIAYTALDQLPFACEMEDLDDFSDPDAATNTENAVSLAAQDAPVLYDYRYPCHGKYYGETDMDDEPIDRSNGMNLAHLLYGYTGMIWPRYSDCKPVPDELRDALTQLEEDGCDVFRLLLAPLCAGKYGKTAFSGAELMGMDPPEADAAPDEKTKKLEAMDTLCKQQQREIQALRASCHANEQALKALKAEKTQQAALTERFRLELAELRESVYRSQSGQTPEEAPAEAAVSFPLHTSRKIVSFGGHPAWLNSIRALLPDVRFIEPDHLPDEQLIRGADAIWLQCNCMSHSDFYKIIRASANANIPLHYFGFASAEQCARQLAGVEADVKA